jgi:hypothetical protein
MAGPALRRSQSKSAPPPVIRPDCAGCLPHLTRPGVRSLSTYETATWSNEQIVCDVGCAAWQSVPKWTSPGSLTFVGSPGGIICSAESRLMRLIKAHPGLGAGVQSE